MRTMSSWRNVLSRWNPSRSLCATRNRKKPLEGVKVIELGGLAPAPFAGMILSDFGASVVRIERPASSGGDSLPVPDLGRRKCKMRLDLRQPESRNIFRRMVREADVLLEPYRPGVMEKLKLGPSDLMPQNDRLIYARMTGYGQGGVEGYEKSAGHDLNYLAMSGVLSMLRLEENGSRPNPPVNILADFAGGGAMCAMGIILALLERSNSGKGQIVDAAMIDGTAYLSTFVWKMLSSGMMSNTRPGTSLLDGGCPYYRCYSCQDGRYVAVGCLEPQFFQLFISRLRHHCEEGGGDAEQLPSDVDLKRMHADPAKWSGLELVLENIFRSRPRIVWDNLFDGHNDCCVTPVLDVEEAQRHEHMKARRVFAPEACLGEKTPATSIVPVPAPRLSETPAHDPSDAPPLSTAPSTDEIRSALRIFDFSEAEIDSVLEKGAAS